MVDDLTLERLLGDAADAIAVPADGPQGVLARRDAVAPARSREVGRQGPGRQGPVRRLEWVRRRPLRTAAVVVASTLAVGLVAGIASGGGGTGSGESASRSASHSAQLGPLAPVPSNGLQSTAGAGSTGASAGAQALPGTVSNGAAQGTPNLVPSSTQSKVIKDGSMTLQVTAVEPVMEQLTSIAGSAGGYVSSSTLTDPGNRQPSSGDVTLRVPEASFESVVNQVRALGKPSQLTISGQDVTSQYADLKARLQAVESTIAQLQLIETKAQTIGDILAVEQEISSEQTQADQLQGQINVLDDQTTYASLSVHVVQQQKRAAAVPPPPGGITKAWDHARHTFASGVESVIAALGGIAVFLLFTGLLLLLARIGWVAVRRRLV